MKLISTFKLFEIFTLLCILFLGCSSEIEKDKNQNTIESLNMPDVLTDVHVVTAEKKAFNYLINGTGKIRSKKEQIIISEIGGRIKITSNLFPGSFVKEGLEILTIDDTELQNKLKKLKLLEFSNRKEYESLILGYENLLKNDSVINKNDIHKKLKIASGLAPTENDIIQIMYDLGKTKITAPFSGLLTNLKVKHGEIIKPFQELMNIYDPNQLLLEIFVLETDIEYISRNLVAEVIPISKPGKKIKASVYEINPYVDENGLIMVTLLINESVDRLLPGMTCDAMLKVNLNNSIVIPKDAIVVRNGRSIVFTVENKMAKWNSVKIGKDNGEEVEILDGISRGEMIVVTNNLQLTQGTPVKVIQN